MIFEYALTQERMLTVFGGVQPPTAYTLYISWQGHMRNVLF